MVVDNFDDIRPYQDAEVVGVVERLIRDPDLVNSTAAFLLPRWHRFQPGSARVFARQILRRRTRELTTINDVQVMLSTYFEHMIRRTTDGFSCSGVERLDRDLPYLFVANHRDIAMDSGFMNYALWSNGLATSQIAVGDNLFSHGFESDLMRLNKSFVVVRNEKGLKAQYAAVTRTSTYIRSTLDAGDSVWIAQREGRSKDGFDRTEPAILKMFMLAYRNDADESVSTWLRQVQLVPVAISYEVDPCAGMKARELYLTERDGKYEKRANEDLESIVAGIVGFKGRVHLNFAEPICQDFESVEALATEIDERIAGGIESYPTYHEAEGRLTGRASHVGLDGEVSRAFEDALNALPDRQRPFYLLQYANQIRNRRELLEVDDS